MMRRSTRTTLPVSTSLLKPHVTQNTMESTPQSQTKQKRYYDKGARALKELNEGDMVKLQPVNPGQRGWTNGQVVKN